MKTAVADEEEEPKRCPECGGWDHPRGHHPMPSKLTARDRRRAEEILRNEGGNDAA